MRLLGLVGLLISLTVAHGQGSNGQPGLPPGMEILNPKDLGLSESDLDKFLGKVKLLPSNGIGGDKTQILTVGFDDNEKINLQDFEQLNSDGLQGRDKAAAEMAFKGFQKQFSQNPVQDQVQAGNSLGEPEDHAVVGPPAPGPLSPHQLAVNNVLMKQQKEQVHLQTIQLQQQQQQQQQILQQIQEQQRDQQQVLVQGGPQQGNAFQQQHQQILQQIQEQQNGQQQLIAQGGFPEGQVVQQQTEQQQQIQLQQQAEQQQQIQIQIQQQAEQQQQMQIQQQIQIQHQADQHRQLIQQQLVEQQQQMIHQGQHQAQHPQQIEIQQQQIIEQQQAEQQAQIQAQQQAEQQAQIQAQQQAQLRAQQQILSDVQQQGPIQFVQNQGNPIQQHQPQFITTLAPQQVSSQFPPTQPQVTQQHQQHIFHSMLYQPAPTQPYPSQQPYLQMQDPSPQDYLVQQHQEAPQQQYVVQQQSQPIQQQYLVQHQRAEPVRHQYVVQQQAQPVQSQYAVQQQPSPAPQQYVVQQQYVVGQQPAQQGPSYSNYPTEVSMEVTPVIDFKSTKQQSLQFHTANTNREPFTYKPAYPPNEPDYDEYPKFRPGQFSSERPYKSSSSQGQSPEYERPYKSSSSQGQSSEYERPYKSSSSQGQSEYQRPYAPTTFRRPSYTENSIEDQPSSYKYASQEVKGSYGFGRPSQNDFRTTTYKPPTRFDYNAFPTPRPIGSPVFEVTPSTPLLRISSPENAMVSVRSRKAAISRDSAGSASSRSSSYALPERRSHYNKNLMGGLPALRDSFRSRSFMGTNHANEQMFKDMVDTIFRGF